TGDPQGPGQGAGGPVHQCLAVSQSAGPASGPGEAAPPPPESAARPADRRTDPHSCSARSAMGLAAVGDSGPWGADGVCPNPTGPEARGRPLLRTGGDSHKLQLVANGLTQDLIDQLGQVEGLQVVSANGVRPYRDRPVPLDS